MKERKYKDDWTMEPLPGEEAGSGKERPVYRGDWFSFDEKLCPRADRLAWTAGGCILFWALLLLYLMLDYPGTRVLYVFLPAGLTVFPAAYWGLGVFSLFRAPERMTRLQKEKSIGRVLHSAAACCVCACMAAVGDLVFLLSAGVLSSEGPGLLLLLAAALSSAAVALRIRKMERKALRKLSA